MNTGTIIDAAAASDPSRIALILDGHFIDYGELGSAVRRCSAGLAANGVLAGDRVAVVDGGSLLSIAAVLGAARIGAAAALMNPALTSSELQVLLDNAGCSPVGIAGEVYADKLRAAGATTVLAAPSLGNDPRGPAASPVEDIEQRDALILFTSGTTGLPKAVAISSQQLGLRISSMSAPFQADVAPSIAMMCVPFFHVGGALGMLGSLVFGQHLSGADTVRCWRVAAPGGAASGDRHLLGADDVAAYPRSPRLRPHRPDVADCHRLWSRRRAHRIGAPSDGRASTCGLRQRIWPNRDPRRIRHADARRSSRSGPGGIRRTPPSRSRSAGGRSRHRQRRRSGSARRVVGAHSPERHPRLATHR